MRTIASIGLLLAACPVVFATVGHAAGLQVAPALVEVQGNSGTIWLTNDNTRTLRAQLRVYRWVQEDNEDKLIETEDLIASPPFTEVPSDRRQVVRLVRFGAYAANATDAPCEQSFRVIVDELPEFTEEETRAGMNYVLRYSVPVFVQNPKCAAAAPQLTWQVLVADQRVFLEVVNTGDKRAQLANVKLINTDGTSTAVVGGLMGYVLPNATRRFAIDVPASVASQSSEIEVQLNGSPVRQSIALSIPSV